MASRKENRLKIPETSHDFSCLETLRADPEKFYDKDKELIQLYEAKNLFEMRELLMMDLLAEQYSDPLSSPTELKRKSKLLAEYMKITGCVWTTANEYYKKISKQLNKVQDLGLLANYAAVVKTDVIQRLYRALLDSEQKELDLNEKTPEELKALKPSQKPLYYGDKLATIKLLLEAADSISTTAIKQDVNVINEDKNRILDKRVDNEGKLGAVVALHFADKTREEKERMLADAFLSNKTISNPVIDKLIADVEFTVTDETKRIAPAE